MKLFDFIKVFFKDHEKYATLSSYDKQKQRFMMNRFMAIQWPSVAQQFNVNGINGSAVVDSWFRLCKHRFSGRVPGWIYTKTKGKAKPKKGSGDQPLNEEAVNFYITQNNLDPKDFYDMLEFDTQGILRGRIESVEKQLNVYERKS